MKILSFMAGSMCMALMPIITCTSYREMNFDKFSVSPLQPVSPSKEMVELVRALAAQRQKNKSEKVPAIYKQKAAELEVQNQSLRREIEHLQVIITQQAEIIKVHQEQQLFAEISQTRERQNQNPALQDLSRQLALPNIDTSQDENC